MQEPLANLKSQGCIPRGKSEIEEITTDWVLGNSTLRKGRGVGTRKHDQEGIASELKELVDEVFWKLNKKAFQE